MISNTRQGKSQDNLLYSPKIYINKSIFSDEVQFGFSGATASSSHLQILPLLCIIEESPSLKMYGHKLWQSPAIGSSWRAKFGSLDRTGSKTLAILKVELNSKGAFSHFQMDFHCFVSKRWEKSENKLA